ncbi:S41 family peptidase [Chitinophaga sp.]|uniref:S41 family peptidase n=1 Tax=Chitinophaga sp. TaxID=1869181 RepID=UPI0031E1B234
MKQTILFALLSCATVFVACRKDHDTDTETPVSPTEGTREQFTLDSIYLYAKEIYLWYDALPDYTTFNPRQYATGSNVLTNYEKELYVITQLKTNPSTGYSYEYSGYAGTPKYSFIDDGSLTGGRLGTVSLADKGDDFGLSLSASSDIRIRYVNPNSPAAQAGLQRGFKVTQINGTAVSTSNTSFIEAALNSNSISMTIVDNNGTTGKVNLTKSNYSTNPVMKDTVLTAGSQKVGYLAYSRFSVLSSSQTPLESAFSKFVASGVTSLIIDLRYNGGGYTTTAEELVNLIAPSTLNGKTMYTEYFNQLLQDGKAPILKQQVYLDANGNTVQYNGHTATYADLDYSVSGNTYKFSKAGSLNGVKQVVFIVSGNTASASELVINSLKPYLTVKLVGSQTYGKPVGFFGVKIDAYTVYMSNFYMQNANGDGDYFQGMTPDIAASDDVTHDFGDANETCIAAALSYLAGSGRMGAATAVAPIIHMGPVPFSGMIEDRLHTK